MTKLNRSKTCMLSEKHQQGFITFEVNKTSKAIKPQGRHFGNLI